MTVGTLARGWLVLASLGIGAGVGSLIGAELTDYDKKGWLLGMAEGGTIATLATLLGVGGVIGAGGSGALVGGSTAVSAAEVVAEAAEVVEGIGEIAFGATIVYAAKEASDGLSDSETGYYQKGKTEVPEDSELIRRDKANVNSEEFKDFIREEDGSFKSNEWKKYMETWETPDGEYVEVHYWKNTKTGEIWSHK